MAERLKICESIPNGETVEVLDTSRVFINLPEDIYPFENRHFISQGATAGMITSGEGLPPPHSSLEEFNQNHCVTHYYELSGNGTVELEVKSNSQRLPDYHIKFIVKENK